MKPKYTEVELKYRTYYKGSPPRPIKLQIPGWSGEPCKHKTGDVPQAWMCPPFVHGSTYGLELIYPFDTECHVVKKNGKVIFEGDFEEESPWTEDGGKARPPFMSFAPEHYGFTSSLDLMPPEGYVIRLEPHPRFYTDTTGNCPIAAAGHLQGHWWPKIFFLGFKAPFEGQTHIFRKGEPYAQMLIVPQDMRYDIKKMTKEEERVRERRDDMLNNFGNKVASNVWKDHIQHEFSDKYKVLARIAAKHGCEGVDAILEQAKNQAEDRRKAIKKIPRRLLRKHTK